MTSDSSNSGGYHWNKDLEKKLSGFSELLDSIESLDNKTRTLWKDIYSNAFSDRKLAQNLYDNLWSIVEEEPVTHAIHGDRLAKYVERMSKSNDQIIKLADLVERAKEKESKIDSNSIYEQLGKAKGRR